MPVIVDRQSRNARIADATSSTARSQFSFRDLGTKVQQQRASSEKHQKPGPRSLPIDALFSFVYRYYSDTPEEVIESAVEAINAILGQSASTDEAKKQEVEALIAQPLSSTEFDRLRSLSQEVESFEKGSENSSSESETEDAEASSSVTADPVFLSLNDTLRITDKEILSPQDIDRNWLAERLEPTSLDVTSCLKLLKELEDSSYETRLNQLESTLGVAHYGLAKLLAKNLEIVYWYTMLANAENGVDREQHLDSIKARRLDYEHVASSRMDQDTPIEVDLNTTGRPVDIPVHLNISLPKGSTKYTTHDYEQYNVPSESANPVTSSSEWQRTPISALPDYVQSLFAETTDSLNVIQSKVANAVLNSDTNILLCAPTGAGKTNVALLALARCTHVHSLRAVYISPLKALVQEQVAVLSARFEGQGIAVAELSGDQTLGMKQLQSVDIIVSTPEKWDIISRKLSNAELVRDIGLLVIDEIHLLHDKRRGRVIENIVARHKRLDETPRLVGLSATLPNYRDVAEFLGVEQAGLFFFDSRFRPVPLEQSFVGVYAQSPLKQARAINQACAEKAVELVVKAGKQALVFVHSRKDTDLTRVFLAENTELELSQIGIHHAGLDRASRAEAEQLFKSGQCRVLVCTATLAWGVNLPAAAVIIKGTQYYDSGIEGWKQLEPQDIMQMLGRAGRPGYDSNGIGIILTTQKYLGYYASIATLSLPIQSYLVANVTDSLNAEIVNYTIKTVDEGIGWLRQTFWYARFQADPDMYGDSYQISSIVHSAFLRLHQVGACLYEYPDVKPTFAGEIASRFYISPDSVATFIQQMKPWLSDLDLMRVFARAAEFSGIVLRRGEIGEVSRLANLVPFPLRDSVDTRFAKICVLLQAYVSCLPLDGLALSSDMAYIAQSASRLYRAFFELSVALKWSKLAQVAHRFYMMVDKRMWVIGASPFRQYDDCPVELIEKAERSRLPWGNYFDLSETDLNETLRLADADLASSAFRLLQRFPRFLIAGSIRPLDRDWVLLNLDIEPVFEYDVLVHDETEQFWVFAESQRGELLASFTISLKELMRPVLQHHQSPKFTRSLVLKISPNLQTEHYPPFVFAKIVSETWLHAENGYSINMRKHTPPTQMLATSSIETKNLASSGNCEMTLSDKFESLAGVARALAPLLASARNAYIGMPPSADRDQCVSIAIEFAKANGKTILVLNSSTELASMPDPATPDTAYIKFRSIANLERISRLPSRLIRDLGEVDHVLCNNLDDVGLANGHLYELLITRLKGLPNVERLIGFGSPVTSAHSLAQWLGASHSDAVNFGYDVLEKSSDIHMRRYSGSRSFIPDLHSVSDIIQSSENLIIFANTSKDCLLVEHELRSMGIENISVLDDDVERSENIRVNTLRLPSAVKAETVIFLGAKATSLSKVLTAVSHSNSQTIIFGDNPEYIKSCLESVLPLESNLNLFLAEALVPEICSYRIRNPQDAVKWLSGSFLYRRLRVNPSFYACDEIQEWVSEAIETAFESLEAMGAIELDEETLELKPKAPAHIACNHGINVADLTTDILAEYESFLEREDKILVLDARIDYAIANNRLDAAFDAIDLRQAVSRDVTPSHSSLYQIPHFDETIVLRCSDAGIRSVQDFIAIEDDDLRHQLLGFDDSDSKMQDIAEFVNNFPIVDITDIYMADNNTLMISIEREIDSDEPIHDDTWYIFIGLNGTNSIMGFKQLPPISDAASRVGVELSETLSSLRDVTVWLMCGNYIEADKEYSKLTN